MFCVFCVPASPGTQPCPVLPQEHPKPLRGAGQDFQRPGSRKRDRKEQIPLKEVKIWVDCHIYCSPNPLREGCSQGAPRARGKGIKLCQKRVKVDNKEHFSVERVVKPRKGCAGGSKTQMWHLRPWFKWSHRSFPTLIFPWFCDSWDGEPGSP